MKTSMQVGVSFPSVIHPVAVLFYFLITVPVHFPRDAMLQNTVQKTIILS